MKIFVVHKDNLVIYALILALICGLVSLNWDTAVAVFESAAPKKDLPIYSVDKGEEKICAISFDAAWGNEDTHDLIQMGVRTYSWTSKGVKEYVYKRAKRTSVKRI